MLAPWRGGKTKEDGPRDSAPLMRCEQIDVELDASELFVWEALDPFHDLWLDLHRTPPHTAFADISVLVCRGPRARRVGDRHPPGCGAPVDLVHLLD
jgi:hypothetical protein